MATDSRGYHNASDSALAEEDGDTILLVPTSRNSGDVLINMGEIPALPRHTIPNSAVTSDTAVTSHTVGTSETDATSDPKTLPSTSQPSQSSQFSFAPLPYTYENSNDSSQYVSKWSSPRSTYAIESALGTGAQSTSTSPVSSVTTSQQAQQARNPDQNSQKGVKVMLLVCSIAASSIGIISVVLQQMGLL